MKFVVLLLLFSVVELSSCANILAIIPSPFYSHQATYRPIWRALAKRGHKITLITTNLMEANENITQIDYSGAYELFDKLGVKETFINNFNLVSLIKRIADSMNAMNEFYFGHPGLHDLIKKNAKFDLMFIEILMPSFTLLSHVFKAPYIGLSTMDAPPIYHASLGNDNNPVVYPMRESGFVFPLTFKERIQSTALHLFFYCVHSIVTPYTNSLANKHIGQECPDMERKASLIFMNANPVFFPTRPIGPATINLEGGLHLEQPKKLPQDLQKYLDQSSDGCIYFSLGSTVNSNSLKPEVVEMFRKTFENLAPIRVLWKFENETLPNKPKNLEIKKWLPQQDVLRHPNVKLFITQGGLQSMEEAIEYEVPMLGIPFYGDQINNVNIMVLKQFGLYLDVHKMKQEDLQHAILELLNNPIYRKTIEKFSKIQKDRPMTAVDKAVWWTEYVLRQGGTEHLKSPSADLPLYQFFFLDILAFVIVVLLILVILSYYSFKLVRFIIYKLVDKVYKPKNKEKLN